MSTEKERKNKELLQNLNDYLEVVPPEQLFEEIEGRYPDGLSLEDIIVHDPETQD